MWAPVTLFPVPAQYGNHYSVLLCLTLFPEPVGTRLNLAQSIVHMHAYQVDPESRQIHCCRPDQPPFSGMD